MKLYLTLHATAELLTEQTAADCTEVMQSPLLHTRFQGKAEQDGWALSLLDRNFFRPAVFLKCVPDADGTLLWVSFKPERLLLLFMCIWTLVVVAVAVWKGLLLLGLIPVFWAVMIVGFSRGVRQATDALAEIFSATEIVA